MRYLSVCSGIEAASVAWHPLGWQCAGLSEIEKFPRAVLEHRLGAVPVDDDHRWSEGQNFTPLFGDFTKIEAHHVGPVDILVGGTPCQSFSIAGKRLGLDDPRGNLALEYLALARRIRAKWILWENVPGVLSHDKGRTFGTFLGFVGQCGFRWAYRVLDAQYARVGRFPRAVPQRRRRVFLVGYSGTADINPAAVLFDRDSLRGNPAPCREAGQIPAPTLAARAQGGGGLGTDFDCDGGLIAAFDRQAIGEYGTGEAASTCNARDYKDATDLVAHSLRAEGFDASEDGTGRGTPLVPILDFAQETADPITSSEQKTYTHDGATFRLRNVQVNSWGVRRLTPRECERLQGFPDDWTAIPGWNGYRAVGEDEDLDQLRAAGFKLKQGRNGWRVNDPDGPRYKTLGNSFAVNVIVWIGERIHALNVALAAAGALEKDAKG